MEWTASEVTRVAEPCAGPERAMLEGWLEWHRTTLLHKCAGLDGTRLARRAAPPSPMSLLGLIRHMSEVERVWFRRRVVGEEVDFLYWRPGTPEGADADFLEARGENAAADFACFHRELEAAREAAADAELDDTFAHPDDGEADMSVRWVFLHMIEEYARHNGHADLLRERIDGLTGD